MNSIKDVAKLAEVAVGTVSRVINNNPTVKPETRKKVLDAIQQLNYVPDEVARNFKMQKSKMVALLLPTIWHPFFSELAYYIEDELDKHDYKLILCNSSGKPQKEMYYFDILNQNKVAGIIGISYNDIEHRVMKHIPLVSIDRHFEDEISCVTSDNYSGGCIALSELDKAGVRNPAFIGYVINMDKNSEVDLRKQGFIDEANKRGISYNIYEIEDQDDRLDASFDYFLTSEKYKCIDGVFINGDLLAAQFIKRAGENKIRVPEDIKVIGYDGIQNNRFFSPYLSTIRQPIEKMARTAVQILIHAIEGENKEKETFRIPVEFRKGETT